MCVCLCVDEACLLPAAVAGTGTGTAAEYMARWLELRLGIFGQGHLYALPPLNTLLHSPSPLLSLPSPPRLPFTTPS